MPAPTEKPPSDYKAQEAARRERLMLKSLTALLDRVAGARNGLPHLAALERGLIDDGFDILATISLPVLTKICGQLSSLPMDKDDRALQALALRLMDTLEARQPARAYPSDFLTESRLMVAEASFTDFSNADASFPER